MKVLIKFLLGLCIAIPAFGETIVLKSGKIIEAKIIEKTEQNVKVDINGVPITYYFEEIESIEGTKIPAGFNDRFQKSLSNTKQLTSEIFKKYSSSVVLIITGKPPSYKSGVGFIVRKDGLIITNFHVLGGAEQIQVQLADGKIHTVVSVVAFDHVRDICIFKINAHNLPAIPIGNTNSLQKNEGIVAISVSQELKPILLEGVFLNKKEIYGNLFLRVRLNGGPGDSGSPVFNLQGNLIGIYSYGDERMKNWNFVIPINETKNLIFPERELYIEEFVASSNKAYILQNDGKDYFARNDFSSAIKLYKQAIAIKPDFAKAYADIATAYTKINEFDMALNTAKKAIELEPNNVELYTNLSLIYLLNNMNNEAISAAKKAVDLDPEYAAAYNSLGLAYKVQGNVVAAKEAFEKAIVIDDSFCSAYIDLVDLYLKHNDYMLARKYCEKAKNSNCNLPLDLVKELGL